MGSNLYLLILKTLLNRKLYQQYGTYINQDVLDKNYPEIYRLYQVLSYIHSINNQDSDPKDTLNINDLRVGLATLYPKNDSGFYETLFNQLEALEVNEATITAHLTKIKEREQSLTIAKLALRVAEGNADYTELQSEVAAFTPPSLEEKAESDEFVSTSLVELHAQMEEHKSLYWRLSSLNRSLGPIRKGNFGFVFARPETGKTTFLASETTHFATQTPDPVIWFNNEQAGSDVMERVYQAHFGITIEEVKKDRAGLTERFQKELPNFKLKDDAGITKWDVERICRRYKPAVIIFDQIDKIKGFSSDRYDLEMKEVYQWARELSKKYGPVIGVCQAGGSGEGKKWLTMNDVDSSKTSKQGEADYILGIGKVDEAGSEYLRYMHLSKNKLNGDENTDPKMRHGRFTVYIQPEIARYTEIGAG